jgi:hypothetical protein
MRVELILPIAKLHGKLSGKAPYYFKTVNGKTFVQRCPNRRTQPVTMAQQAARERFATIAGMVKQMLEEGSTKSRKQLWKIAIEAYDATH